MSPPGGCGSAEQPSDLPKIRRSPTPRLRADWGQPITHQPCRTDGDSVSFLLLFDSVSLYAASCGDRRWGPQLVSGERAPPPLGTGRSYNLPGLNLIPRLGLEVCSGSFSARTWRENTCAFPAHGLECVRALVPILGVSVKLSS